MHTFAVGEIVTAANLNNNTSTALDFLLSGRPIAKLRRGAAQTIPTSNTTSISFDTVITDRDGGYNSSSPTIWTCHTAGWYSASHGVPWVTSTSAALASVLQVNGSSVSASSIGYYSSRTSIPSASDVVYLNVGDQVSLGAYQTSGGDLATSTNYNGAWLTLLWEST
jgi:hypothetical protein